MPRQWIVLKFEIIAISDFFKSFWKLKFLNLLGPVPLEPSGLPEESQRINGWGTGA